MPMNLVKLTNLNSARMRFGLWFAVVLGIISVTEAIPAISKNLSAAPESSELKIIAEIPTSVTQILTSGTWSSNNMSGTYRVLVVNNPGVLGDQPSRVFLQWLRRDDEKPSMNIFAYREIKEAFHQKFYNSFVFIDAEENNSALLIISSFDKTQEQDRQLWIKASLPGQYELVKPEESRGSGIGSETNVFR